MCLFYGHFVCFSTASSLRLGATSVPLYCLFLAYVCWVMLYLFPHLLWVSSSSFMSLPSIFIYSAYISSWLIKPNISQTKYICPTLYFLLISSSCLDVPIVLILTQLPFLAHIPHSPISLLGRFL